MAPHNPKRLATLSHFFVGNDKIKRATANPAPARITTPPRRERLSSRTGASPIDRQRTLLTTDASPHPPHRWSESHRSVKSAGNAVGGAARYGGADQSYGGVPDAAHDTVYMQPSEESEFHYIGRVDKIERWAGDGEMVRVSWFYRPEEALGGRKVRFAGRARACVRSLCVPLHARHPPWTVLGPTSVDSTSGVQAVR